MIRSALGRATGLLDRFVSSAVLMREASRTSRRWQTYASRVGFTGALFGVLLLAIYMAVNNSLTDTADMGWMGRYIFIAISSVLMLLAVALAPLITSGAIIEETEDRTLEMLVLSKLEPSQILAGKVASRILILLTIVFGALPVMAMVVTLGGVAPQAVVSVTVHALVAVVMAGSLGAFYGLFTRSPLLAMLASVAWIMPTSLILPLGYVASTGHPNDSVHFSLFAGPAAQDWSSPVAVLTYLPSLVLIFVIGTRLFELRIAGADIRKAFSSETWGTRTWLKGLGLAVGLGLLLPAPIFFTYTLRYGTNHWAASVGVTVGVALIWAWWTLVLTLMAWVMLRVGVDVVDAMDAVLGGRGKRKRKRLDVRVWSNPVAWREARPAAWTANGGALLATWLLGMLGMFQTGTWLIPGGSLVMGAMNTLAAFGLTVWLAARSVEEERRNQSLEVLLTTTLASHRILLGKALGVGAPTLLLLLLSLPFVALGYPHLHMFDILDDGARIGTLGWLIRGIAAWVWTLSLWAVLLTGSLLVGLRTKGRRSGFAVATGLMIAAVGVPGALGRIFEDIPWIAHPMRLIAPPLAGGADPWHYAVATAAWGSLAIALFAWTSIGLRRWISAALGVLLGIGVLTQPVQAQPIQLQDNFAIVAQPLGEGLVRSEHWSAVQVKIINQGRAAQGRLTLVERSGTTSETFERSVELPAGARKDVILLFRPNASSRERTVQLVTRTGRQAIATFQVRQASEDAVTIGVLGNDLLGIQAIRSTGSTSVPGPRPRMHHSEGRAVMAGLIEPGVLPNHSRAYSGFDVLVWHRANPAGLTPPQLRALEHWVADGGHLVLTVTENWRAIEKSPLSEIVPVDFVGTGDTTELNGALRALGVDRPITAPIPVGRSRLRDLPRSSFVLAATDDDIPVWTVGQVGLGSVSVLSLDPKQKPLVDAAPELLWRRLLFLEPDPPPVLDARFGARPLDWPQQALDVALHRNPAWSDSALNTDYQYTDPEEYGSFEFKAREWLSDIPGVAPLPMSWLLAFSGLYLFVIGPLDWLVLRLLRRQPWTWVTFPVTIVVFSSVALVGTTYTKGDQATLSTFEVIDVLPGTKLWRGDTLTGLFVTGRTEVRLRAALEDSLTQPLGVSGYLEEGRMEAGLGPGALRYGGQTWTMAYAQARWVDEAPGTATLVDEQGQVMVHNGFPFALRNAVIALPGERSMQLGDLAPGVRKTVGPLEHIASDDMILLDTPSLERGYLDLHVQPVLIADIDEPVAPLEVQGARPTRRSRTTVRVPLGWPVDPTNSGRTLDLSELITTERAPPLSDEPMPGSQLEPTEEPP